MSADTGLAIDTEQEKPARKRKLTLPMVLILLAAALALFSLVRILTGAQDITSSGTVGAALRLAVPIGMAGLGGLWAERSGVVNIGLEGMLILGTWGGAYGGYHWGPWVGLLCGVAFGALGGLLHAVATVTFGVDHIVSGVAITILGGGVTRFLSALTFKGLPGGDVTQSPSIKNPGTFSIPGTGDWLLTIEKHHWFFVSDLAGVVRGLTTGVSKFAVIAVLLVPLSYWVLWKTRIGLRIRYCGENPTAAESLGVNVYRMKYLAVVVSGGLAGFGGAFISEVASGLYREGQTNGRGYIGLAAMIFGNWRPGGLAAGAGLFGYTDALNLRSGGQSVHALLLLLTVLLVALAGWSAYKARWIQGGLSLVFAVLLLWWFFASDRVPDEFVGFAPHLTTLLVLSLAAQRLRMPAADGKVYRRGEGR